MEYEKKEMDVGKAIKLIATYRGYTLKKVGDKFNELYGTNYVRQSFNRKFNKGKGFTFEEVEKLGAILGFKVKIVLDEDDEK